MPKKNTYIVSYDISKDKKRARAANTIKNYGVRVQKSVFECRVKPDDIDKLMLQLEKIIDFNTDSVLVYFVCDGCLKRKKAMGQNNIQTDEDFCVI